MKDYGDLVEGAGLPVHDLMEFLFEEGLEEEPAAGAGVPRVAYHDACHALRAQGIQAQPRTLLGRIPGLAVVDIPNGDRCCGAAGLYNVMEPEMASRLGREKADSIASTLATTVASANPGCTMQIAAGLKDLGIEADVVHPVQLLDRAYGGKGNDG
jgi:glycolate oxidase iron-sulfur subunit